LVQLAQLVHHPTADIARWHITLALGAHARLDAADAGLDHFGAERPLVQRPIDTFAQFVLVIGLGRAVLLDNARMHHLGDLEGGEALLALGALAPPTHLAAVGGQARIEDARTVVIAERAVHGLHGPGDYHTPAIPDDAQQRSGVFRGSEYKT